MKTMENQNERLNEKQSEKTIENFLNSTNEIKKNRREKKKIEWTRH